MKFSTRTLYGLRAILVLAAREGAGLLSVSAIAKKESLSVHYLEQILNALKKKGLVKSVRGPQGGYTLAEKPADITLEKLFWALETKNGVSKVSASDGDETSLADSLFWNKFSSSIEKGLSETTLKELLDEARRLKKGKSKATAPTFHI
jgi:Rrf2 family protein